ncbi:MAG: helix-turn-helix domain-containing protein [Pseudonocardiaceae bacterium]
MTEKNTTTAHKLGRPKLQVSAEQISRIKARAVDLEKAEAAFRAEVFAALEAGASIRETAAAAGRSQRTIQNWWNEHRAPDPS